MPPAAAARRCSRPSPRRSTTRPTPGRRGGRLGWPKQPPEGCSGDDGSGLLLLLQLRDLLLQLLEPLHQRLHVAAERRQVAGEPLDGVLHALVDLLLPLLEGALAGLEQLGGAQ